MSDIKFKWTIDEAREATKAYAIAQLMYHSVPRDGVVVLALAVKNGVVQRQHGSIICKRAEDSDADMIAKIAELGDGLKKQARDIWLSPNG